MSKTDPRVALGPGGYWDYRKLLVTDDGLLRTTVEGTIAGEFVISGLKTGGRITTMSVGDSAIAIPAAALANRNAIKITNLSEEDVLYIGFNAGVTADRALGTTAGDEVNPNEAFQVDITPDITLYGITEAGKSILVKVVELA